jgi:hypothetical protein
MLQNDFCKKIQWKLYIPTLWNKDILWNKDTSSGPQNGFLSAIKKDTSKSGTL